MVKRKSAPSEVMSNFSGATGSWICTQRVAFAASGQMSSDNTEGIGLGSSYDWVFGYSIESSWASRRFSKKPPCAS